MVDFRRGYGLWLVSILIALGCVYYTRRDQPEVVLWGYQSVQLSWSFAVLGPVGAAWGAWLAGRERRSRTETLLASTPMPAGLRDARVLAVPVIGALSAYAGIGAYVLVRTALAATWGGPVWSVILFGAWLVAAYTVVGSIAGSLAPTRLTPLITGFGLFLFTTISYTYLDTQSAYRFLAPFRWVGDLHAYDNVLFHGDRVGRPLPIAFALALGVVAAAVAVLAYARVRRRAGVLLGVVAALVLAPSINAAITPLGIAPSYSLQVFSRIEPAREGPVENPPLVCGGEIVETCVHQAYEGQMDEVAIHVDAILAPVAGLAGVPERFEQRADAESTGEVARFIETWQWGDQQFVVERIVMESLFTSPDARPGWDGPSAQTPAQAAIGLWLVRQAGRAGFPSMDIAGYEFPHAGGGPPSESEFAAWQDDLAAIQREIDAAAERFAVLPPEDQRVWLEANWDALRSGDLTLEDLP